MPDSDQVGMGIECHGQFKPKRVVHQHIRYAQVNQAEPVAKLHSQLRCPVLRVWIIGAQATGVRGSSSYIDQLFLRSLLPRLRIVTSCLPTKRLLATSQQEHNKD